VRNDSEKKVFFGVLWFYLAGALVFFISLPSIGLVVLPRPVWLMFLLLTAGFILFMFIPLPGRMGAGMRAVRSGWYPRTIEQIMIGDGEGKDGIRPPLKAIAPVPLAPLVLLLVVVLLYGPQTMTEDEWRAGQTERLSSVYRQSSEEVRRLELLACRLGESSAELVSSRPGWERRMPGSSHLFYSLDSLAASVDRGLLPIKSIGIQVYSPQGDLVAWGGRPLYRDSSRITGEETRVFTSRTSLYMLLVCGTPFEGGGWAVVDIPLEVNYRIHNRYLSSVTLGEILGRRYGAELNFNFSMGEHRGSIRWRDESIEQEEPQIITGQGGAVQVYGYVRTAPGEPLASVVILGAEFAVDRKESSDRRIFLSGIILTVAVLLIGVWGYRLYSMRYGSERPRPWKMLLRIVVFAGFLFLMRFILLELDLPRGFFGSSIFDPAIFADDVPAGLARTAGDLLITALFALVLVFGSIKIFRTYYPGVIERALKSGERRIPIMALKGAAMFLVVYGSFLVARNVVSRVVFNSNPRLIGLDVSFLDIQVLILHLAMLFIVSAVFIAALFVARLVLVWKGPGLYEGMTAAALALLGIGIVDRFDPLALLAAAGLLVLSIRVFPLVKKEDIISIIFSSFFLVIIVTLLIYGTAEERYDELRRSRLLEKLSDFNSPEDNWLQVVLPDLCQDIAEDRVVATRVATRKESAAFEIWAESSLSRLNLSCIFDVFDVKGERISRFSVGAPYELEPFDAGGGLESGVLVEAIEHETKDGTIHYFRGVAGIKNVRGDRIGRVEVTIPYFFENLELLARSGPVAPEILHNIERGAVAPRIDEPENLLVARIEGDRVVDSSDPGLFPGTTVDESPGSWFGVDLGDETYRAIMELRPDGRGFLVGFKKAGIFEQLLRWATIVSLDVILMLLSLLAMVVVNKLPLFGSVTPSLSIRGGLGFRQKVLLSFLLISIVPVVILGAFSGQFIERRFRLEGEREALEGARSASSLIAHSILSEAESFSGSQYLQDILSGDTAARIRDVALYEKTQFTLFSQNGDLLLDESMSDFDSTEVDRIISAAGSGKVLVLYDYPYLYGGVTIPVSLGQRPDGYLYFRRRIDDEFINGIASVMGVNVNVFYRGTVRASSQRELFIGGFLDPLIDPLVFADVALLRSKASVRSESLGDYTFQVASTPLLPLRGDEAAVLTIPMLYQPVLVRQEILKSTALIMGLLALLFAATVTIGIFLAGKIFNPIAALQAGTRRIIEGDLEFKLESSATDELGQLVDSFNTMTEALREARRNLLERQRYLTAVLDSVATGVITTDGEGRIMTINPSGEHILQIERSELEGKDASVLERLGLGPLCDLVSEGEEPVRESELTLFGGEKRRTIKAVVTSLVEGDEMLGTVIVFDDLTELIRSKKLAAWVEMARQIAHEVKNPLTPIRLSAQLMRRAREAKAEDFDEIFESGVETVIQQTEILRRIASEFSSFGKTGNLRSKTIELGPFLEEFTAAYRGAEKVDIRLEQEKLLACVADPEGLRKILVNLIENALEAMQNEGMITVRAASRGRDALISIIDSGPGLSPEAVERLFEPYFSTKTNGTGLGLAISQSLAREMEGEITIRNREDLPGTEATLRLPLAQDTAPPGGAAAGKQPAE
jgi:signal transduction histidine kinase